MRHTLLAGTPEATGLVGGKGRERHRKRVADAGRKPDDRIRADAVSPGRRVAASSSVASVGRRMSVRSRSAWPRAIRPAKPA
jgi:hypothetical protein